MKTLHNSPNSKAQDNVPDIVRYGNPGMFELLCKASSESEGWMKSTKAMQVPGGGVVQTTTQQINPNGSSSISEALVFVPWVIVRKDIETGYNRLML